MVDTMGIQEGFRKTETGIIPFDWDVIPIKNLLIEKLQNGVFYKPSKKGTGIKLINVGDLYKGNPINVDDLELFDASSNEEKTFKVLDGDLFFTRSSVVPAGIAYCNIYVNDISEKVVFDSHVIKARPDKKIVDPSYLFRYCSYAVRNYFVSHAKTAIMTTIDQAVIERCPIALPPTKAEQSAIANALNDADKLITALEKLIAKKRAIKQGAMQELLKPKEGWEDKRLGQIAEFVNGRAYRLSEWESQGTPVIRLQNLTGRGAEYYYSNLNLPEKQYCETGDLLFMWSGTFGPVIWKGERAIYHYHIWKVKCKKGESDKGFLLYILDNLTEQLKLSSSSGGIMLHVTKERMETTEIIVPSVAEQTRIAQVLSDMDTEIEGLERKLEKYRMIKQGMMQNLLTGKIRLV